MVRGFPQETLYQKAGFEEVIREDNQINLRKYL